MKELKTILWCRYFGVAVILGLSVMAMASKTDKTPTEQGQTIVSTTTNYKPEENYQETLLNLNLDMVYVQGGTFKMGATGRKASNAEKPVHKVTLSSYHIGKYEITQAQWKAVMGTNPSELKGDNLPVENITWYHAKAFCDKLSAKTGKNYTLPTEAQWEFAARGGVKSKGYKYSGSNTIGDVAWYAGNSMTTHSVGTKAPNELGIYDMTGNVWEWCADGLDLYSSEAVTNPVVPPSGFFNMLRGGGWFYGADDCRVSKRFPLPPGNFDFNLGFRVVCLP